MSEFPEDKQITGMDLLGEAIKAKSDGEERPEQSRMVEAVEDAIQNESHLLIQAGTGVGKTLGYLLPLIASGKKAVISTATNQLAQQAHDIDLPLASELAEECLGKPFSFSLIKGRSNYLCLAKLEELTNLDKDESDNPVHEDLFEDVGDLDASASYQERSRVLTAAEEAKAIYEWAEKTNTGERFEAPAVSDKTWANFSSTSSECPGKRACPFGEVCYTEIAKEKASQSQILVTNHALTGLDLDKEEAMFGERQVLVIDEAHEMDNYFTTAWGSSLDMRKVKKAISTTKTAVPANELKTRELIEELEKYAEALDIALEETEQQRFENTLPPHLDSPLQGILGVSRNIESQLRSKRDSATGGVKIRIEMSLTLLGELQETIELLRSPDPENVRWAHHEFSKKETIVSLQIGPLRVGPKLMESLHERNMTLVATSATITVGGSFEIPARNLSLNENIYETLPPRPYNTVDVGTPFDYKKQSIRYIPKVTDFPAPIGKDRFEHSEAVIDFVHKATLASQGRALILSSTTREAQKIGEFLKEHIPQPVLVQGDMPTGPIVDTFVENTDSVLVGTMGFWHGLNAPGQTCSLVIIDKIPFTFMDAPLLKARMEDVQERGGNGFMDIYVANANVMLAQGVGRLIRHTTDRGVVAILDTRLRSKPYGKTMLKSLPDMWETASEEQVLKSLANI